MDAAQQLFLNFVLQPLKQRFTMHNLLKVTLAMFAALICLNVANANKNEPEPGILDGVGTVLPAGTPNRPAFVVVMDNDPMFREYWAGPRVKQALDPFVDKKVKIRARIRPGDKNPNNRIIIQVISVEEAKK